MRCINCESMKIIPIDQGCGAEAKCLRTSKKGRSIYWAMTTILEKAEDRVVKELNKKQNAPFWCPKSRGKVVKKCY